MLWVSSILKAYFTALAFPFIRFWRPTSTPDKPPGTTPYGWPENQPEEAKPGTAEVDVVAVHAAEVADVLGEGVGDAGAFLAGEHNRNVPQGFKNFGDVGEATLFADSIEVIVASLTYIGQTLRLSCISHSTQKTRVCPITRG